MTGLLAQPVAVLLALAAAICFAVANVLQQRVACTLPQQTAFDTGVLVRLFRRPLWLLGFAAIIASISLQAAALGTGRLVVIEPVLASSLLVALALSSWVERRRMRPIQWCAAIATFAGLAVFLVASQPSGGQQTAGTRQLAFAAVGAFVIAGIAVLIAVRLHSVKRALILGIGGGVAAGVTDALTKTVAFLAGSRELAIFADPRLYLLVVVGLMTYTMQQNGYRAAALAAFLPAFAVLDPVIGSLLGLFVYHERLGGGPVRIVIESAAALLAAWGIARLASSSAAPAPPTEPEPVIAAMLPVHAALPVPTVPPASED
ncbi:MAG TPA: DMT family transporter [Streptosporangiaceae bacterium]|nr:DMT family transporter [Streptosporangiaceae bacterium]